MLTMQTALNLHGQFQDYRHRYGLHRLLGFSQPDSNLGSPPATLERVFWAKEENL